MFFSCGVSRWNPWAQGQQRRAGVHGRFSGRRRSRGLAALLCVLGKVLCSMMPRECCWRHPFMLISISVLISSFSGYPGV